MTLEEAKSKTVWLFQCLGKKRKQGIQVRNIAEVENSSCVTRFAVGALPGLKPTKQ